jgi:polysaccharide export outer membrane protein
LRINVWKTPDLSVEVTVRPDGTITLPLIGDVTAAGRTPSELRDEIKRKLTISARRQPSRGHRGNRQQLPLHRGGNVEKSGMFTTKHYVTVTEAVALAGGPNRYADLDKVLILRQSPTGARSIPVNIKEIYSGRHPEMDVVILKEDRIFVP